MFGEYFPQSADVYVHGAFLNEGVVVGVAQPLAQAVLAVVEILALVLAPQTDQPQLPTRAAAVVVAQIHRATVVLAAPASSFFATQSLSRP